MVNPITVYVPNLKYRDDRRKSIVLQFANKSEFSLNIIEAKELNPPAFGLWQTFYDITYTENEKNSQYFIFCEDDHVFTEDYNWLYLKEMIAKADSLNAEILSGGMSVVNTPVFVDKNLFWVSSFNGMQFTVVFNRLYEKIIASQTTAGYVTDIHLSYLAKDKFVMFPYISEQKDFGYSDVTKRNNEQGRVKYLFNTAQNTLSKLYKCHKFFSKIPQSLYKEIMDMATTSIYIPTYIINLKERKDRLNSILEQFCTHEEFHVSVTQACKNSNGAVGLWNSICNIIREAKANDHDCVLICEDDHIFTKNYHKETFIHQVILAGNMGAQLLNGGIGGFGNLVPITSGLYWCDWFWCTQFIVVYKNAYDTILNASFNSTDVADEKLSSILTNKMVIVPFVSEQADFGYSDVTSENNNPSNVLRYFDSAKNEIKHYMYEEIQLLGNNITTENNDIKSYLKEERIHALHLGCGHNILKGWLNTDLKPTYGAIFLDVTQRFPLPDNCMNYIYAEHLFDIFAAEDIQNILQECYRVLKYKGVIRFTIFSHENIVKLYSCKANSPFVNDYIKWNLLNYSPNRHIPNEFVTQRSIAFTNFMHKMQDGNTYDFETMKTMLNNTGFSDICQCDFINSKHKSLNSICHYKSYMPKQFYQFETLTIEASKL